MSAANDAVLGVDWLSFNPSPHAQRSAEDAHVFLASKPDTDWDPETMQGLSDLVAAEIRVVLADLGVEDGTITKICFTKDVSPTNARALIVHALRALGGHDIPDNKTLLERAHARMTLMPRGAASMMKH